MMVTVDQRWRAYGFRLKEVLLTCVRSFLMGLACLALIMTPAAALEYCNEDEAGVASSSGMTTPAHADAADLDLHCADSCCHTHILNTQTAKRGTQSFASQLVWRMSHSGDLAQPDFPLLRPPRI